jgi:hypothetical protein
VQSHPFFNPQPAQRSALLPGNPVLQRSHQLAPTAWQRQQAFGKTIFAALLKKLTDSDLSDLIGFFLDK